MSDPLSERRKIPRICERNCGGAVTSSWVPLTGPARSIPFNAAAILIYMRCSS
jgi:hypothetical protein